MVLNISIYSPKSQPFGLLSNNALTEFVVEGLPSDMQQRYRSVTEYIFLNLFPLATYRTAMVNHLYLNPLARAMELIAEDEKNIYAASIIEATTARLEQNKNLRAHLYRTRGKILAFLGYDEIPEVFIRYLDVKRSDPNVFFDPVYGDVNRNEVDSVINYAETQLLKDPEFPNLSYSDMLKMNAARAPSNRRNDVYVQKLDDIVPVLKHKLAMKLYENSVKRFKEHLLDVHLDQILATEYPHIAKQDYAKAKRQQIVKQDQTAIYRYEDQLWYIYEHDEEDVTVLSKLQFRPLVKPSGVAQHEQSEEGDQTESARQIINVKRDDPIDPTFQEPFRLHGSMWKSPYQYAYHVMFKTILGLSDYDVNGFRSLSYLKTRYENVKRDLVVERMTKSNEIATFAKFKNDSLTQLLLQTGNSNLVWGDRTDEILGSGKDSKGSNRSGTYLTFLRDNILKPSPHSMSYYPDISSNVVFRSWLQRTCEDIVHVIHMIRNTDLATMLKIYGIESIREGGGGVSSPHIKPPTARDINVMKSAGVLAEHVRNVWIIVMHTYMKYAIDGRDDRSEIDAIRMYVRDNFTTLKPTNTMIDKARNYLRKVYVVTNASVTVDEFIDNVLSGADGRNRWPRIKYWSQLTSE